MATAKSKTNQQKEQEEVTQEVLSAKELKAKADAITTRRTLYAAGAGLIPIPVVDAATILGIQTLMIRDIAKTYNVPFKEERTRALITSLVGDLATVGVVSGIKAIPVVGTLVGMISGPVTGAASTYALGKVFTQHFDQGGTFLNFDPLQSRKYFQDAYEEGKLFVKDLDEEEEESSKNKGWKNMFGASNSTKEIEGLRKDNEQMKKMISDLQKSIDSLKKS